MTSLSASLSLELAVNFGCASVLVHKNASACPDVVFAFPDSNLPLNFNCILNYFNYKK